MSCNVSRTPELGNQMLETGAIAGSAAAVLTIGLVEGVWRLVAWVGRQQLATDAGRHCCEAERFMWDMTRAIERLANELGQMRPGLTPHLVIGLTGLSERGMWFIEDNYKAFVLGRCGTQASAIHRALGEWLAEPLRHGLDATRRAVGREFNEERHAADRKRLNELIRRTENELVECAFRVLHADIARPGERACRQRLRVERFLITLILSILTVAVLHFCCFPEEWIPVSSPTMSSDKQPVCGENPNCGFLADTGNFTETQSRRPRARGAEQGRATHHTTGAPPSAALRHQSMLHRHLE
jgi:hypothetical protein